MACTKAEREVGPKQRGLDIPVHLIVSSDFVVRTPVSPPSLSLFLSLSLILRKKTKEEKRKKNDHGAPWVHKGTQKMVPLSRRYKTLPPELPLRLTKYFFEREETFLRRFHRNFRLSFVISSFNIFRCLVIFAWVYRTLQ